jgi:hypothetical protein
MSRQQRVCGLARHDRNDGNGTVLCSVNGFAVGKDEGTEMDQGIEPLVARNSRCTLGANRGEVSQGDPLGLHQTDKQ